MGEADKKPSGSQTSSGCPDSWPWPCASVAAAALGRTGGAKQVGPAAGAETQAAHLHLVPAGVSPAPRFASVKTRRPRGTGPGDSGSAPGRCGRSRASGRGQGRRWPCRAAPRAATLSPGSRLAVPTSDTCHFKHDTVFKTNMD